MRDSKLNAATEGAAWRYGTPAIFLHWALAFLIVSLVGVGWYMMDIEDEPGSEFFFDMHKSFGILVFALVMLRILWRAKHAPAALPASLPRWQVLLSNITQWTLYASMVLMPVLGFLGASYSKNGIAFFGLPIPRWRAADHDTAELFFSLHSAAAWVLVALVAIHVVGGLKHLFVDKDGVFQRMWFS